MNNSMSLLLLNRCLTERLNSRVRCFGILFSAFQLFGYAAFAVAISLGVLLATFLGLATHVIVALILTQILGFFMLASVTKNHRGTTRLVLYRHAIVAVVVTIALTRLLGAPTIVFLDVVILSIGSLVVVGRLGCLMAGCCYGRPCRHSFTYAKQRVTDGFPTYMSNVPLFPVQILESLVVAIVVFAGVASILSYSVAGTTTGLVVVGYACARYVLEFFRGDCGRRYWIGLSEAQWTAALTSAVILLCEFFGWLPFHTWHAVGASALLMSSMVVVYIHAFAYPNVASVRHLHDTNEIARFLRMPVDDIYAEKIPTFVTSEGIRLSVSTDLDSHRAIVSYCISGTDKTVSDRALRLITDIISLVSHRGETPSVVFRRGSLCYLLFRYDYGVIPSRDDCIQPGVATRLYCSGPDFN